MPLVCCYVSCFRIEFFPSSFDSSFTFLRIIRFFFYSTFPSYFLPFLTIISITNSFLAVCFPPHLTFHRLPSPLLLSFCFLFFLLHIIFHLLSIISLSFNLPSSLPSFISFLPLFACLSSASDVPSHLLLYCLQVYLLCISLALTVISLYSLSITVIHLLFPLQFYFTTAYRLRKIIRESAQQRKEQNSMPTVCVQGGCQ